LHNSGGDLVDSTITFASSYWCQYRTRPLELGTLPASWVGDAGNGTATTYGTPGGANPLGVSQPPSTAAASCDEVGAYPNPFRASTTIRYNLTKQSSVQLSVYNVLGQAVYATQPRVELAGSHTLTWNGQTMPQGVYFYQLTVDGKVTATRRMTLIK
jgi:hypothetical protein